MQAPLQTGKPAKSCCPASLRSPSGNARIMSKLSPAGTDEAKHCLTTASAFRGVVRAKLVHKRIPRFFVKRVELAMCPCTLKQHEDSSRALSFARMSCGEE
jgi:hypothetical protein